MINTVPMEKNGITNVICNLVTNVNNENIQIDCVAINDVDLSYKNIFKKHGGKIFVIPQRLSKPIAYIKKLVSIIKKKKMIVYMRMEIVTRLLWNYLLLK